MDRSGTLITINKYQYKLEKKIGQGSCGQVYRAINQVDKSLCAIKIMRRPTEKRLLQMIATEVKLLRGFTNESVIKYYDDGQDVMELAEFNLKDYCLSLQNQSLSERDTIRTAVSIIEGIFQLYLNQIVHRDLKTQNILIVNGKCKISDFGIAVQLTRDEFRTTAIGTPYYMAPEILENKAYDYKVDIWCLGIIIFEIYFSEVPFFSSKMLLTIKECCATTFNIEKVLQNYQNQSELSHILGRLKSKKAQMSPELELLFKRIFTIDPVNRIGLFQLIKLPIFEKHLGKEYCKILNQMQIYQTAWQHNYFLTKTISQLQRNNQFTSANIKLTAQCIRSLEVALYYFNLEKRRTKSKYNPDLNSNYLKIIQEPWEKVKVVIKQPLDEAYTIIHKIGNIQLKPLQFRIIACMFSHYIFKNSTSLSDHFSKYLGNNLNVFKLNQFLANCFSETNVLKLAQLINEILIRYCSNNKNSGVR